MRIQHNILAMNAYRNYNNNTSALSKNLEKLSSGYKINRAGDDAAGLAISEKMRAQITGLSAASKNVKDGISLVKTAEGAMQEIQDMLNRMDYLATQSANGTYDNEVDRANLQKEVEALTSEIDRIAESANFNGIKLLDGSKDSKTAKTELAAATAELEAAQNAVYPLDDVYAGEVSGKNLLSAAKGGTGAVDLVLELPTAGAGDGVTDVGSKTVMQTNEEEPVYPSFVVNLDGLSHTIKDETDGTNAIKVTVGGTDIEITEEDFKTYAGKGTGETVDAKDIAKTIAGVIGDSSANDYNSNSVAGHFTATGAGSSFEATDGTSNHPIQWKVTDNEDGTLTFAFDTAATGKMPADDINAAHFDVKVTPDDTNHKSDNPATKASYTTGTLTATASTDTVEITVKYKDAGSDTVISKDISYTAAASDDADAITAGLVAAINADATLSGLFSATGTTANNGIKLETKDAGAGQAAVTEVTVKTAGTTASLAVGTGTKEDGVDAFTSGTKGYLVHGTADVQPGSPAVAGQLASTTIDLSKVDISDGMKIRLGDTEYTFAVGADSKFAGAENVVDMRDYEAADLAKGAAGQEMAANRLSQVAVGNETFSVTHEGGSAKIAVKQLEAAKDKSMKTADEFLSYIGINTVDSSKVDAAAEEADAARQAAVDAAQAKVDAAAAKVDSNKALKLQIGDTSDSFNQMEVEIGNMHAGAMYRWARNEDGSLKMNEDGSQAYETGKSIGNISIANQEAAADAVQTIKDAINYVSSIRGDLGAIQNRLEHTGNNLSVMAENIQDAESTIRDTDVAEEMMGYVKNNILVQSAQAMLAQANQVPQGVLQLLG